MVLFFLIQTVILALTRSHINFEAACDNIYYFGDQDVRLCNYYNKHKINHRRIKTVIYCSEKLVRRCSRMLSAKHATRDF